MVVNRPTVIIYTRLPDEDLLREICAGIEEEGVLYEVHSRQGELDDLAFEAAKESMLGSGLPLGKNVFELIDPHFWQCRNLGSNSARAVKKMPFKEIYGEGREMSV